MLAIGLRQPFSLLTIANIFSSDARLKTKIGNLIPSALTSGPPIENHIFRLCDLTQDLNNNHRSYVVDLWRNSHPHKT